MGARIAGLVADLLLRTCNATSVERQSFIDGSRYMIRFGDNKTWRYTLWIKVVDFSQSFGLAPTQPQ